MDVTMTPRDIQLRIRSGDSLADVIAASGLPADRVEGFAAPILAEREHTTATALSAPVRRRGETASARRLRQTVAEALLDRGEDIDFVVWDSWRRSDGRWILAGTWTHAGKDLCARFLYDPKSRFSMADNDQARLLVGDFPLASPIDESTEPTERVGTVWSQTQDNLADETTVNLPTDDEDSLRSDIDLLYDMISTIDEDSVRIFRGLRDTLGESSARIEAASEPAQPSLIEETADEPQDTQRPSPRRGRKRAEVPSWDDILFGGR
jgi:hypothetical protein